MPQACIKQLEQSFIRYVTCYITGTMKQIKNFWEYLIKWKKLRYLSNKIVMNIYLFFFKLWI